MKPLATSTTVYEHNTLLPIQQNPLSGECGILAVVNAMRWLYPRHMKTLKACEGLYCALISGMSGSDLMRIAKEGSLGVNTRIYSARAYMKSALGENTEHKLFDKPEHLAAAMPPSKDNVWVVGLWDHWSVVVYTDATHAVFYDSYYPDQLKREKWEDFDIEKIYNIQAVRAG